MLMVKNPTATGRRERTSAHDSFLRYRNFRWAKIAGLICVIAIAAYMLIDIKPHPSGSTAEGYVLGTIGALLILWLTLLGVRKRAMTPGRWSLRAWTSAHVYLGLSLIVIATLHTGFQFGWNVHTLAYALMMLVILSGIWGITMYGTLPQALSDNREMMTETQMLEALRSIDRQLHDAAQPLPHEQAALVLSSLEQNPFGGGLWARLTGRYRRCATRAAQIELRRDAAFRPKIADDPLERVDSLLERKSGLLARVRRHLKLKALLEVWLYVHVPVTFALIAALSAHIVSVFFYW
ncbi:hypothetical protein ACFSCW_10075 [Sphingomonas tabacisoli]|uniref:Ferric reductase like transmembrane component n=1 Tax=Sphingomonas tabacisoli TaxID=2249466 RepID=A0ABW4I3M7_9SPHN